MTFKSKVVDGAIVVDFDVDEVKLPEGITTDILKQVDSYRDEVVAGCVNSAHSTFLEYADKHEDVKSLPISPVALGGNTSFTAIVEESLAETLVTIETTHGAELAAIFNTIDEDDA